MKPHINPNDLLLGVFVASRLDWNDWMRGLLSAIIGGGSAAVSAGVAVPTVGGLMNLNIKPAAYFSIIGFVFLASAAQHAAAFLSKKPIPDELENSEDNTHA